MALNEHEIMGRLTRDPELTPRKNSESSDRVNFTVAVDDDYGDGTEFFNCVAFGKKAEIIDKWFKKGDGIYVRGNGHNRKYTGKDGVERTAYSIMVNVLQFPPGKKGETASSGKGKDIPDNFEEQAGDIPF